LDLLTHYLTPTLFILPALSGKEACSERVWGKTKAMGKGANGKEKVAILAAGEAASEASIASTT